MKSYAKMCTIYNTVYSCHEIISKHCTALLKFVLELVNHCIKRSSKPSNFLQTNVTLQTFFPIQYTTTTESRRIGQRNPKILFNAQTLLFIFMLTHSTRQSTLFQVKSIQANTVCRDQHSFDSKKN